MYRLYDAGGGLLYIGITQREPRERFKEHRKTMLWWPEVARRDVLLLDVTFHAAELLERAAIRDERPLYNHHGQPSDEPGKRRQRPDGYWTQPWRCDYPDPASWSRAWFEWRAVVRDERLTPAERAARNAAGAV
jgi:predicted GIY-YIG superfamily endonuclease